MDGWVPTGTNWPRTHRIETRKWTQLNCIGKWSVCSVDAWAAQELIPKWSRRLTPFAVVSEIDPNTHSENEKEIAARAELHIITVALRAKRTSTWNMMQSRWTCGRLIQHVPATSYAVSGYQRKHVSVCAHTSFPIQLLTVCQMHRANRPLHAAVAQQVFRVVAVVVVAVFNA